jgi:hypothetical protein
VVNQHHLTRFAPGADISLLPGSGHSALQLFQHLYLPQLGVNLFRLVLLSFHLSVLILVTLQMACGVSERRACQATGFGHSSQRDRKRSDPQAALRMRLEELAAARVLYSYRRLHILLRREGWKVHHKRTYRIYRHEGLSNLRERPLYRGAAPSAGG